MRQLSTRDQNDTDINAMSKAHTLFYINTGCKKSFLSHENDFKSTLITYSC